MKSNYGFRCIDCGKWLGRKCLRCRECAEEKNRERAIIRSRLLPRTGNKMRYAKCAKCGKPTQLKNPYRNCTICRKKDKRNK